MDGNSSNQTNQSNQNYSNCDIIILLIFAIVGVLVLFLIYPRPQYEKMSLDGMYDTNELHLVTDQTALAITNPLVQSIVTPCMLSRDLKTKEDKINCITTYKYYYDQILKYPLADIFYYLQMLGDDPFDKGNQTRRYQQQYIAAKKISGAFADVLSAQLYKIYTTYDDYGYDESRFTKDFNDDLSTQLYAVVIDIVQNPTGELHLYEQQ